MITIDTVLVGLIGGLLGLKVALLGVATLLFVYGLRQRIRRDPLTRVPARTRRRPSLDVHA